MRLYEPHELGRDGYPPEWHETIKHEGPRGRWPPLQSAASTPSSAASRRPTGRPVTTCASTAVRIRSRRGEQPWHIASVSVGRPAQMVAHGRTVEAAWRILTVHHLDGCKANCRWWNLVALCQRKVQMARVWPWEHSDWFQPYVAGYYAHVYLGEDLERHEVEARVDELLALERIAA